MMGTSRPDRETLELARDLVAHLEANEVQQASEVLAKLTCTSQFMLFQEIGRLARELHTAINEFLLDSRLADIAEKEIPNATEGLRYVIDMTEQAANTTLTSVEQSLPLADNLQRHATRLAEHWERFNSRERTVADFGDLSDDLKAFLAGTQRDSQALHDNLTEVLMAQDFQDLTGQILGKVIALVGDVENKLVDLVRISGSQRTNLENQASDQRMSAGAGAHGPLIPGVDKGDVVCGQDDVDDLLSSMGF